MRYAPLFVTAGLLVSAGVVGAMYAQPEEAPADAVGFTSAAAQKAQADFEAAQARLDSEKDQAVDAALAAYRGALNTAKGQALNEKNLPAANQIAAAVKAIDTPDEEAAVDAPDVVPPPECPDTVIGQWRQIDGKTGKQVFVFEFRKDHVVKQLESSMHGCWYVQGGILVATWPDGAVDRFTRPEGPEEKWLGRSTSGYQSTLLRK